MGEAAEGATAASPNANRSRACRLSVDLMAWLVGDLASVDSGWWIALASKRVSTISHRSDTSSCLARSRRVAWRQQRWQSISGVRKVGACHCDCGLWAKRRGQPQQAHGV